jgi:hypothetical protein
MQRTICRWLDEAELFPGQDIEEGGEFPDGWVVWGRVLPLGRGPIRKYFILKLPSYQYGPCSWDDCMNWSQLWLMWTDTEGHYGLSCDGWRLRWVVVPPPQPRPLYRILKALRGLF